MSRSKKEERNFEVSNEIGLHKENAFISGQNSKDELKRMMLELRSKAGQ